MTTTQDMKARVKELSQKLAALPEAERTAVIEGAISLEPKPIDFCPFIPLLSPTAFEKDLDAIMGRVSINAKLSGYSGQVINVGEAFQVDVTVRNCTGHDLSNVKLEASSTSFAAVTGLTAINLGDLPFAAPAVPATFKCKAIAVTPTPSGPADTLINLRLNCNIAPRGGVSKSVEGEISIA